MTTSTKIKFLDLNKLQPRHAELRMRLDEAYSRVMYSGQFIGGEEIEIFENRWADYCGVDHCVAVGSGFDALQMILRAYGIGSQDEVIVPTNTCLPTWLAVSATGAIPVGVEPNFLYVMDWHEITSVINWRTKAVIPVHLYGLLADMNEIREIARENQLLIIEDACQAHGSRYYLGVAGSLGDAAAFSFYPTKNLGCYGDAGAIVTNDGDLAERVRALRRYGVRGAINSCMDTLQAAFLNVRLDYLDYHNARRRTHADIYNDYFVDKFKDNMSLFSPKHREFNNDLIKPNYHQYVIKHQFRDSLKAQLASRGIETMIHYPVPPHKSNAYAHRKDSFPVAEKYAREVLSLPVAPHLGEDDIAFVAEQVIDIVKSWQ